MVVRKQINAFIKYLITSYFKLYFIIIKLSHQCTWLMVNIDTVDKKNARIDPIYQWR